jgi:integral membrane sensor domain MASE1
LLRDGDERLKALKTAATLFVTVCVESFLLLIPVSSSTQPHTVRTVVFIVLAVVVGVLCAITVFRINRSRRHPQQLRSSGSPRHLG